MGSRGIYVDVPTPLSQLLLLPPRWLVPFGYTTLLSGGHARLHARVGCICGVRVYAFVLSSPSILCTFALPNMSSVMFGPQRL